MFVNFKKLHDDVVLPKYAKLGDAGLDCYAVSDPIITNTYVSYKLGFAVEFPIGYVGFIFPRSSISKYDLVMANSVGVIDSQYRGEVEARFKIVNNNNNILTPMKMYNKGDAICQLIIMPHPTIYPVWVDILTDTDRGSGGFGHTSVLA